MCGKIYNPEQDKKAGFESLQVNAGVNDVLMYCP